MLGIFLGSTVSAISAALTSARATNGTIVVVGDARIGQALAARGLNVTTVVAGKAGKRVPNPIAGSHAQVPLAAGSAAAVVGVDARGRADVLAEWSRLVCDGGTMVLIDKAAPHEATRTALIAGLSEIEQRPIGRHVVTSGLVTTFG